MINILIVDDSQANREITKSYLQIQNVAVHEASDGQIGLEKFRDSNGQIDLIIIDHHMPNLSGLEMLKLINKENSIKKPKTLVYSSSAIARTIAEYRAEGIAGYLRKPADRGEFVTAVQRVLEKSGLYLDGVSQIA